MYLDFYHLKKAPFHITPDPEFLFLSLSHKAALGALVYGIEERQGFVALIGEVGLGKTTILRSYLERVDQSQLKPIYIFNSNVSFSDLLKTLCREFGIEVLTEEVADTVNRLHQVLIEEYKQGRNVALIVDEAQHMPIETLEHLRMLSNLETSTQKLIQIVLVGQPEFDAKLNNHALRQLKQRLVIRGTISPLTNEESRNYIIYRLAKVVTVDEPLFTRGALREIVKQAKGTPRVINILCTNALIHGRGDIQIRLVHRRGRARDRAPQLLARLDRQPDARPGTRGDGEGFCGDPPRNRQGAARLPRAGLGDQRHHARSYEVVRLRLLVQFL